MKAAEFLTQTANREDYYKEHGWDGAEMFDQLFSGDRWKSIPADATEILKICRMCDQILWFMEVNQQQRLRQVHETDTATSVGALKLVTRQLNLIENKLMNIKHERYQQSQKADEGDNGTPTPAEEGSCTMQ